MVYYGAPEGEHAPLAHFPPTASVVGLHPDVCFGPDCAGAGQPGTSWKFALSGDSRNCGEIVTPAIAAGVLKDGASFYSRLGDYRAIYMFDEDYLRTHPQPAISDYENAAWPDFINHQLKPFGKLPVFLAVGNHELIPPKTHNEILAQFTLYLSGSRPDLPERRRAVEKTCPHIPTRTCGHSIPCILHFATASSDRTPSSRHPR